MKIIPLKGNFECVIELLSMPKTNNFKYNVYMNEHKVDIEGNIPISAINHILVKFTYSYLNYFLGSLI